MVHLSIRMLVQSAVVVEVSVVVGEVIFPELLAHPSTQMVLVGTIVARADQHTPAQAGLHMQVLVVLDGRPETHHRPSNLVLLSVESSENSNIKKPPSLAVFLYGFVESL